jgi:Spy/CpxP family protein refolding chaperone
MKRNALFAAIAAIAVSAASWAGPGMGYGMGGGMGYGPGGAHCMQGMEVLGLTAEQRDKIAAIEAEAAPQRLALMASMRELRTQAFRSGQPADPSYAAMEELRRQMFDLNQETRARVDAVLTPEQRSQWRPGWRGAPWRG